MTESVSQTGESVSSPKSAAIQVPTWLVGLMLLALLWHGAIGFLAPDHDLSPDEIEYLALAESIGSGEGFVLPSGDLAKRLPVYPWLLSLLRGDRNVETWRSLIDIAQSILAAFATIGFGFCGAAVGDKRTGILTSIIAALYAPFAFLQTQYLTETLTIVLMVFALALYLGLVIPPQRSRFYRLVALTLVSVALALATLTRANMAVLFLPIAVDLWLRRDLRGRLGYFGLLLLPAVLILGGWAYRNHQTLGKFTLSTIGGLNFYLGNNSSYADDAGVANADYQRFDRLRVAGMTEIEADAALYAEGLRFIKETPQTAVANLGRKLIAFFEPTTKRFGPILLVVVTGLPLLAWWTARKKSAKQFDRSQTRRRTATTVGIAAGLSIAWLLVWIYKDLAAQASTGAGLGIPPPYISPHYLLPLGGAALLLTSFPHQSRRLLIGILLAQTAVGLVFIPLSRIRWTVDGIFIIALAVATVHLIDYLREPQAE